MFLISALLETMSNSSISLLVDNKNDTCIRTEVGYNAFYHTFNVTKLPSYDTVTLNILLPDISSCPTELAGVLQDDMEEPQPLCSSTQVYHGCRTVSVTPEHSVCQAVCDCQGFSCYVTIDIIYKLRKTKVTYCEIWG